MLDDTRLADLRHRTVILITSSAGKSRSPEPNMNQRLLIAFFLFLSLLLQPHGVFALAGGEVQVATSGRDDAERSRAYLTGLRWLLQNRPEEFGSSDFQQNRLQYDAILGRAADYVDAFEFIEIRKEQNLKAIPVTASVRESGKASHILLVQYSMPALRAAISDRESPDVGAGESTEEPVRMRKLTSALMWLLVQDGSNDLLVSNDTAAGVVARLRELAGALGWSFEFPILDTRDLAFVGPEEINQASQQAKAQNNEESLPGLTLSPGLLKASTRYREDLVLTATAVKSVGGIWQLQMRRDFVRPDETIDQTSRAPFTASGPNLDKLLQQAIAWNAGVGEGDNASDTDPAAGVASSGVGLTDKEAKLWVDGLDGAPDYLRLMRLVKSLPEIERAATLEVRADGVLIGVNPRSALPALSRSLQSKSWLRLAPRGGEGTPAADIALQVVR